MEIKLYKTVSPANAVHKELSDECVLIGTLRDGNFTLYSPVVGFQKNISEYNYAYIPSFGRYYFIDNIRVTKADLFTAVFRCDVLMTYEPYIRQLFGVVSSGSGANPYTSSQLDFEARHEISTVPFECPFTDGDYVVISLKASDGSGN